MRPGLPGSQAEDFTVLPRFLMPGNTWSLERLFLRLERVPAAQIQRTHQAANPRSWPPNGLYKASKAQRGSIPHDKFIGE